MEGMEGWRDAGRRKGRDRVNARDGMDGRDGEIEIWRDRGMEGIEGWKG